MLCEGGPCEGLHACMHAWLRDSERADAAAAFMHTCAGGEQASKICAVDANMRNAQACCCLFVFFALAGLVVQRQLFCCVCVEPVVLPVGACWLLADCQDWHLMPSASLASMHAQSVLHARAHAGRRRAEQARRRLHAHMHMHMRVPWSAAACTLPHRPSAAASYCHRTCMHACMLCGLGRSRRILL